GAEDTGLRPITQSQCDQTVYIPMAGNLQSLNVTVQQACTDCTKVSSGWCQKK
ncbi:hypothetical protein BUV99_12950, partial [Corynebacterium diphtheriae]